MPEVRHTVGVSPTATSAAAEVLREPELPEGAVLGYFIDDPVVVRIAKLDGEVVLSEVLAADGSWKPWDGPASALVGLSDPQAEQYVESFLEEVERYG